MKRLQRTQTGRDSKARKTQCEGRKPGVLEKWLRQEKDSEATPQSLKRKASEVGDPEPPGQEERKSGTNGLLGT